MALPPGYRFARCTPEDLVAYRSAFERAVGREKPDAYFRYNHGDSSAGPPVREKLLYGDEIVGSHTVRAVQLQVRGEAIRAGLTMDSFISPEHRHRGLFTAIARHTTALARARGMEVIFGFANANSIHAYKKYLRHEEPGALRYITVNAPMGAAGIECSVEEQRLSASAERVIEDDTHAMRFACSLIRTPNYVRWRYLGSPVAKYCFVCRADHFLCILKEYGDELQLVDLFMTERADPEECLLAALGMADSRRRRLSLWLSSSHPLNEALENHPHDVRVGPQHLHIACYNERLMPTVMNLDAWHYVMGDSDVF